MKRRPALLCCLAILASGCAGSPPYGLSSDSPSTDAASPAGTAPGSAGRAGDVSAASSALLEQSRSRRQAGDIHGAMAMIERAIRIDPADPWLWLELGKLHMANADYPQAESVAYKALTLAPGYAAARQASLELIVRSLYAQGRNAEAAQLERELSR
ncbi:MAG: tetratricopeptide repeat protein [Woeseiaceae bacterium]